MRVLLAASVLALSAFTIFPAHPAPIATRSEISVDGSDTFRATALTFTGPGNLGGTSGSFSELPNCFACVTFPIGALHAGSSGELWAVTDGALSSTLTINSDTSYSTGEAGGIPNVIASGTGTLTLTGFDTTAGIWELTGQGPEGTAQVTWSATAVAQGVPEPTSLILLATGIVGLGLIRRRRSIVVRRRVRCVTPASADFTIRPPDWA